MWALLNLSAAFRILNVHEQHADLSGAFRAILEKSVLQLINARQLAFQFQVPAQYLANLYVSNTMTFITWTLIDGEDYHIVHLMNQIQSSLVVS